MDTIKEGVAHGEIGSDEMAGEATSAGFSERTPGKPDRGWLQSVDSLALPVE